MRGSEMVGAVIINDIYVSIPNKPEYFGKIVANFQNKLLIHWGDEDYNMYNYYMKDNNVIELYRLASYRREISNWCFFCEKGGV